MTTIKLGAVVLDTVTGIQGTYTAVARYLHERPSHRIEYVNRDGEAQSMWVDRKRLHEVPTDTAEEPSS